MADTQRRLRSSKDAQRMMASNGASAAAGANGNGKDYPSPAPGVSAQAREAMVAQLAYSRAEKRGFAPGGELQDWFEAEAEVELLLR